MRSPLQICSIDLYCTRILNPSLYIYIYYTCSSYRHALLDLLVQKVHHLKPSGTLRDGRVWRGLGEIKGEKGKRGESLMGEQTASDPRQTEVRKSATDAGSESRNKRTTTVAQTSALPRDIRR